EEAHQTAAIWTSQTQSGATTPTVTGTSTHTISNETFQPSSAGMIQNEVTSSNPIASENTTASLPTKPFATQSLTVDASVTSPNEGTTISDSESGSVQTSDQQSSQSTTTQPIFNTTNFLMKLTAATTPYTLTHTHTHSHT